MSISQRLQRQSILDQRAVGGRGTGERAPTYRGELLHKRDEYGTTMDDQQYSAINKQQAEFKSGIASAKAKIAKQESDVQKSYETQKGAIGSVSYDRPDSPNLPSKEQAFENYWGTDTAIVRATHGDTVYKTWEIPKALIPQLSASFNKGDGSYVANWVDGGKFYNIDTEPQGVGSEYGLELGEALDKIKGQAKESYYGSGSYESQYSTVMDQYGNIVGEGQKAFDISKDSAYSVLNRSYTVAQEGLTSARSQVASAQRENQNALNTIRNRYSKKIEGVRQTLTELFGDKNGSK